LGNFQEPPLQNGSGDIKRPAIQPTSSITGNSNNDDNNDDDDDEGTKRSTPQSTGSGSAFGDFQEAPARACACQGTGNQIGDSPDSAFGDFPEANPQDVGEWSVSVSMAMAMAMAMAAEPTHKSDLDPTSNNAIERTFEEYENTSSSAFGERAMFQVANEYYCCCRSRSTQSHGDHGTDSSFITGGE
jgi:hypothetical protein